VPEVKLSLLWTALKKTKNFGMPHLNIVGITATYNTFSADFAFLCEEIEEMHSWALQKYKDM
jgi:hypothetical protein